MISIRWCGARARVAASGLAVPMSMSRYTSAESTLMSSTGSCCASSTATLVLPLAVGPIRKMAGGNGIIAEHSFLRFGSALVDANLFAHQRPCVRMNSHLQIHFSCQFLIACFAHHEYGYQADRGGGGNIAAHP